MKTMKMITNTSVPFKQEIGKVTVKSLNL